MAKILRTQKQRHSKSHLKRLCGYKTAQTQKGDRDMTEKKTSALNPQLKARLRDTAWQRGLTWRNQLINAIAEARRLGVSDEEIFRQLKIAGLIDATAKAIMRDASYLEESETPFMDYVQQQKKQKKEA